MTQQENPVQVPDFRADINLRTAQDAYNGISFSPEKRGVQTVEEYQGMLAADYVQLKAMFEKAGKPELFEEEFARYRLGFKSKFNSWLGAKSRCISSMIAGPSKFPTRRAEKANRSEDNRYSELKEFQQRAKKAMEKLVYPYGDGTVIRANDPEAVQKLQEKADQMKALQESMKAANKVVKNKKLTDEEKVAKLGEMGWTGGMAREILKPDFCGRIGFADYQLSNNLANIKRVEQRIADLQRAETAPAMEVKTENGIEVFEDEGRVQIKFPGKPDEKVRAMLRGAAFKWSPTRMTWVRQATGNARYAAEQLVKQLAGGAQ